MDHNDIPAILADHALWLADSSTGKRANLNGVDLTYAHLRFLYFKHAALCDASFDDPIDE